MSNSRPAFQWDDALLLDAQLTEEERMVRDSARAYCQDKLLPRVLTANREERFDREIMRRDGRAGPVGLHAGQLGLRRPEPCGLRPGGARSRAGGSAIARR